MTNSKSMILWLRNLKQAETDEIADHITQLEEKIAINNTLVMPVTAEQFTEHLTAHVMKSGYKKVGYVLQNSNNDYCISAQSGLRFISNKQCWQLMNPND